MGSAAQLSTSLYRQYRWLDDCRTWPPTLAHLRSDAHERRLFEHSLGQQRALHFAGIHGTLHGTRPALHGSYLPGDQHGTRARAIDARRFTPSNTSTVDVEGKLGGQPHDGFIWFWLVAVMIVGYVVLDGFDLGVECCIYFCPTRRQTGARFSPASDPCGIGNEVWLLAGGGTLYFAFPLLYASAFSGFYLPLRSCFGCSSCAASALSCATISK